MTLWNGYRSGSLCRVKDSLNMAALKRWIVTDSRWKMTGCHQIAIIAIIIIIILLQFY